MGRRVNQEAIDDEQQPEEPATALEGGSLGVTEAKNTVGGAQVATTTKVFEAPKPKRFRVTNYNPVRVNLNGGVTLLQPGQLVDDMNYDIEGLKKLGVQLQGVE